MGSIVATIFLKGRLVQLQEMSVPGKKFALSIFEKERKHIECHGRLPRNELGWRSRYGELEIRRSASTKQVETHYERVEYADT